MPTYAIVVHGIVMAVVVWLLIKWQKPADKKEAFSYSVSWTVITFLLLLVVTIGNDTTGVLFGNWGTYLDMALMILPPMIEFRKKS